MCGGAGGDLVDGAAVARAGVGRVGLVVDFALHEMEDVEDGDLGEGEGGGDEEAGEEDFDGVDGPKDLGEPGRRGLLGVIAGIAVAIAIGDNCAILLTGGAVEERCPLVS